MTRFENLEKLLSSDNKTSSIIELDDFIGNLCSFGEDMDKLTEPQKIFFLIQNLEREVNNGGFNQYFINSSGDFAHQTVNSLTTIGAKTTADILQRAIDQFPDQKVPHDRDQRIEVVEQIEDTANMVWDELDQRFFKYVDDLSALNLNYISQNKDYF